MTDPKGVSRRDFLFGRFRSNEPEVSSRGATGDETRGPARHGLIPVHRPPGALPEARFLEACTRCGECIVACPHDAITIAPPRMRTAAGTPVIDADQQPCRMCPDLPCITVCEPGALIPRITSELGSIRMATVHIESWACLAHQGNFCTVCSEQCPVPGALVVQDGKPKVDAEICTGCGVCRYACPAPDNAVLLMPIMISPAEEQDSPAHDPATHDPATHDPATHDPAAHDAESPDPKNQSAVDPNIVDPS